MITEVTASVIASGLGALITILFARAWFLARALRKQRLCSIEGTFETHFELKQTGPKVIERAMTQLSQTGKTVRGVTSELVSGRTWQLEGVVDHSGFLRGTYRAMDEASSISGTFLLAIEKSGEVLDGLWASFDRLDREVASGRYSMRRTSLPEAQ